MLPCYMENIGFEKPDVGDWPDTLKLQVLGVPIVIEYENAAVIAPHELKGSELSWGIAKYLIDEGFIKVTEEIEEQFKEGL